MSTHPGLNRLSRDEVCDKYLTLYDTHEGLKKAGDNDLRQIDKNRIKALKTQSWTKNKKKLFLKITINFKSSF
jgi:hypothetical protein